MALKLLKVTINLEIKADRNDEDQIRERVYEELQVQMENDDLVLELSEDEEEVEDEA